MFSLKIKHKVLTLSLFCLTFSSASADEVFQNYYFESLGTCLAPEQMTFNKLTTAYTVVLGQNEEGHDLLAWVNLSLFEDKSFISNFFEYWVEEVNGEHRYHITFAKAYVGTWERSPVPGKRQLDMKILNDQGSFDDQRFFLQETNFSIGDSLMLGFAFSEEFERSRGEAKMLYLHYSASERAAWNESAEEYCQDPY